MADISPHEIQSAAESGWTLAGIAASVVAAISAGFWKLYRVVRRFEVASQDIDALKAAEADRKDRDSKLDVLLDILVKSKTETDARLTLIERKLPDGPLMDQDGVWAVFGKQQEALSKVEAAIRHDMTAQHSQLRAELTNRMDDMKADIRQANDNIISLITRTPTSRATDND